MYIRTCFFHSFDINVNVPHRSDSIYLPFFGLNAESNIGNELS